MFNPIFQFASLRVDLYSRLTLRGIKDVHITWNDDYLAKIDALPEGPEKEAAKDETADKFAKMFKDIETGAIVSRKITSDTDIEKFFKDGTQKIDPKVQEVINNTTLIFTSFCPVNLKPVEFGQVRDEFNRMVIDYKAGRLKDITKEKL